MRSVMFVALLCAVGAAAAADDYRIIKLEQDMRNLERQVQTLQREVSELRTRLTRSGEKLAPARTGAGAQPASSDWLVAANWDRVRVGMNELDVIGVLGPPSSIRTEGDARMLLYAMELGANAFLGGSVTLRERQVIEVQRPQLH